MQNPITPLSIFFPIFLSIHMQERKMKFVFFVSPNSNLLSWEEKEKFTFHLLDKAKTRAVEITHLERLLKAYVVRLDQINP